MAASVLTVGRALRPSAPQLVGTPAAVQMEPHVLRPTGCGDTPVRPPSPPKSKNCWSGEVALATAYPWGAGDGTCLPRQPLHGPVPPCPQAQLFLSHRQRLTTLHRALGRHPERESVRLPKFARPPVTWPVHQR